MGANIEAIEKQRKELIVHCRNLIDIISNKPYACKLLLAAARSLETIADYKANRNGNYVKKFSAEEEIKN
jgi:hypothetical protein